MRKLSVGLFGLLLGVMTHAAVIHVPGDYPSIQAGINVASVGDTVLVDPGTYFENIDFVGKEINVVSAGGSGVTVIDGGMNGSCATFITGETNSSVLDGFTLSNGSGYHSGSNYYGGGILCWGGSPTIRSCVIEENQSTWGGGVYARNSSVIIEYCLVINNNGGGIYLSDNADAVVTQCQVRLNSAGWGAGIYSYKNSANISYCTVEYNSANQGGGVALHETSATVSNCVIRYNTASQNGGGIICYNSAPLIKDCEIYENQTAYGGGICFLVESSASVYDCVITGNYATNWGAGIYSHDSSPVISNCEILENNSSFYGGGIAVNEYSSPQISNCLVRGNYAWSSGGGLFSHTNSHPIFLNCTVVYNEAGEYGGGLDWDFYAGPTMTNCILFFNLAPTSPEIEIGANGGPGDITYCNIAGGWSGEGNIDADPIFVTGPEGDYYLSQLESGQPIDSPCKDAGSNFSENICYTSLDGIICLNQFSTRTDHLSDIGIVDMGYHYPANCSHSGDVNGNGIITAGDAQLAFFISIEMFSPTYEEFCAADCDGNGIVTAGDAQSIFMMVLFGGSCVDPV